MKYILVTGGAGNVGSSLVHKLIKNTNYFVVVIDNLSTGKIANLPNNEKNLIFFKADTNNFLDLDIVFSKYKFNFVFHYAALVGVKRTIENPLKVLEDIEGFKNILHFSVKHSIERIFFSSSSEVYGEPVEFPQNEDTTALNARLPYAVVKNIGECYLKAYKKEFDLNYTIFRFFNTYGVNQSNDFVISKFIEQAINSKDITIYGDGQQTRTFCFSDDNIETTINVLEKNQFVNDIINIGNNEEITIIKLAELVIKLTNSSSKIIFLPPLEEGDMTRRLPDISKMQNILNRNLTSLEDGLNIIINNRKKLWKTK